MNSSNTKVNDFLTDIESTFIDKYKIIETIRATFLKENDQLEEDIKYGGIVFNLSGELISGIFLYKKHISIEFSSGATFDDPSNLLEGKGKFRRHIKIQELGDIETKTAAVFIKQAVK